MVTTLFPLLDKGLRTKFPVVLETATSEKLILPILAVVIVAFDNAEIYQPKTTAFPELKFTAYAVVMLAEVEFSVVEYQLCVLPVVAVKLAKAEI
jgi:hypothetical protein